MTRILLTSLVMSVSSAYAEGKVVRVEGIYVSSEKNGAVMSETISIRAPDGNVVRILSAYPRCGEATTSWPSAMPPRAGARITVTYREQAVARVVAVQVADGAKASPGAITGEFLEVAQGDLGASVLLKRKGKTESFPADFDVVNDKQAQLLKGKQVQLRQESEMYRCYVSHQVTSPLDQQPPKENPDNFGFIRDLRGS